MAKQERGMVTINILDSTGSTSIPLPSVAAVYTKAIKVDDAEYFAVGYKVTAVTSSSNATIVLEQSPVPAATDGTADDNFNTPVGVPDIVTSLTTRNTWNYTAVSPVSLPYVRFKVTGALLNSTSIVNIKITKQVNG